jgi:hypothetical protein
MQHAFPQEELAGKKVSSPWNDNLFKVDKKSQPLEKSRAEQFHTTTAQGLFLCKRGRPDICPAIAYLSTQVRNPNQDDWTKLVQMMKFLIQTKEDILTIELVIKDGNKILAEWYVDAFYCSVCQHWISLMGGKKELVSANY